MLSVETRRKIIDLRLQGKTIIEIAKETGASTGSVHKFAPTFVEMATISLEKDLEIKRLREALVTISMGCQTGAKGCTCLENLAMFTLAGGKKEESESEDQQWKRTL